MNNKAKETAKNMLKSYLQSQGININKNFSCLSREHEDKHPSMSYNEKTNTVTCFGCGEHGDIFDVIRMQYGIPKDDYKQIFETTYRILGINNNNLEQSSNKTFLPPPNKNIKKEIEEPKEDLTLFFKKAESLINTTDYAQKRGLTDEVIKRFHLGFDPAWISPHLNPEVKNRVKLSPRLIIPTSEHSYLARDVRDNLTDIQKKYSKIKVGKVNIFNKDALKLISPIFVVEGEIDAMSIVVAGGEAVALGSSSNVNLFLTECKNNPPKGTLILCPDNDESGKKAMAKLSAGLIAEKIPFLFANISDNYKDANERLVNDKAGLEKAVALSINHANEMTKRLEQGIDANKFVDNIKTQISDMKDKIISTEDYWQNVFTLLNTAINEVQQVRSGLRVLKLMAVGIKTMEERLGRDTPKEAIEIKNIAEKALSENNSIELKWEKILSLVDTMQKLSQKSMEYFKENKKMSPLFSLPKFRTATPLQNNEISNKLSSKELYPKLIKKIILENKKITGIYEADYMAGQFLKNNGFNTTDIEKTLIQSPRIAHLTNEMKKTEIKYFVSTLLVKEINKNKSKDKSRT